MPDISKCKNEDCPIKNKCYRYTSKPSTFRQSYASFKYRDGSCDYFYKIDDSL